MGHGETQPPQVHWIVVRLSAVMPKENVSKFTGVSVRSVERILQHFRIYGTVKMDDLRKERVPQRGQLKDVDLQVSADQLYMHVLRRIQYIFGVINRTPDVYLDELQEMLDVNCEQEVSRATIWRALTRQGFTMKKVCSFDLNICVI